MPPFKLALAAMLFASSLVPFVARAAGLGEMAVSSQLGDRFRAEIPLLNPSPSLVSSCFRLTTESPDAMDDVPWLNDAQIVLLSSPPRLVISTRRQVSDPVLQLAVHSSCGSHVTRYYTALLSPLKVANRDLPVVVRSGGGAQTSSPGASSGKPASLTRGAAVRKALDGETTADMARRLYPRQPQAQKKFIRQMVALNPEWLVAEAGDELLPEGVDLHYPKPIERPVAARPARPTAVSALAATKPQPLPSSRIDPVRPSAVAESQSATKGGGSDRLVLMPSDPPLLPEQATTAEIGNRLSDVELQIGTMRMQLNTLRAAYPTPTPDMQTLFLEMETRLMTVELDSARLELAVLTADKPAPSPAMETPAAEAAVKMASNEKVTSMPTPVQVVSEPVRSTAQPKSLGIWLTLFGSLSLALGAVVYRYRRTRRGSPSLATVDAVSEVQASVAQPVMTSAVTREHQVLQEVTKKPTPIAASEAEEKPEKDQDFNPIDLANIMLAFGRTEGAAEVLESFVEENPNESLQPGLSLLSIYKQGDRRREFEHLAEQLAQRFNIQRARWDDTFHLDLDMPGKVSDTSSPPGTIETIPPHIQNHIVKNWGTGECLDYLRDLLKDNRNGARQGFSLPETREILGLIKVLEGRL